MLVSLGGRRAPSPRIHTPPAKEEVLNTGKNPVKFECMSVNAGVLSEQTVLSPLVSSAPANSALCARTTGQPSTPRSWASRGDAVTAPRGQLAAAPGEMKGCDRGHAASHCWQQRLTLPRAKPPVRRQRGEQGPGHLHLAQRELGKRETGRVDSRAANPISKSPRNYAETLQRHFVFKGKEKQGKLFVIHPPLVPSTACTHPPLALPLPSSQAADKLYRARQLLLTTPKPDFYASAPFAAEITSASQGPPAPRLYFQ